MKLSYILQLKQFGILLIFGIILGIFYGLINIHNQTKRIFPLQIITDIIFPIVGIISLIIIVNKINYGQLRLYLIFAYLLGFAIERITLGNLFAKGYKWVYTYLIKLWKNFSNSKIYKVIFK